MATFNVIAYAVRGVAEPVTVASGILTVDEAKAVVDVFCSVGTARYTGWDQLHGQWFRESPKSGFVVEQEPAGEVEAAS